MFIEGYIDREYLRMLQECGYDVVWEITTRQQALEKGYSEFWPDLEPKDTIARFFIDDDIEDILTPEVMTLNCKSMLPLRALSTHKRLKDYAVKQLRGY
jgi:hypothetical protein